MIKFDETSIKNRMQQILQSDPNWKAVMNGSVVTALLQSSAEATAETARYAEYLFRESKWDTANNPSSIRAMAGMLGYRPHRKISATGTIRVSADSRISQLGDDISFKALEDENYRNSVNWKTPASLYGISKPFNIGSAVTIVDAKNVKYIASKTTFNQDSSYVDLQIMQGEVKETTINRKDIDATALRSKLDAYLFIPVQLENCEAAITKDSKALFKVTVFSGATSTEYRIVDTLIFSQSSDKDVELVSDLYNPELVYLKFNNNPNRGDVLDLSKESGLKKIVVTYISTKGNEGNIGTANSTFTISNVAAEGKSGQLTTITLHGKSISPLTGGADEEQVESIKENAPLYYMNNYTAGTKEAYENTISHLKFNININNTTVTIEPRKVKVSRGEKSIGTTGATQPTTRISFLSKGLDDMTMLMNTDIRKNIKDNLELNLNKIISPQDNLEFYPPKYVPFAVGLKYVRKDTSKDSGEVAYKIQSDINDEWGAFSTKQDFDKDLYESKLSAIAQNLPDVEAVNSVELEAITQIDWNNARRINSNNAAVEAGKKTHTIRVNYSFDSAFRGEEGASLKGFKDKNPDSYVMRIDILYKIPSRASELSSKGLHSSIFIQDKDSRDVDAFYLLKNSNANSGTWSPENFDPTKTDKPEDYDVFNESVCKLDSSQQVKFQEKVFFDSDYEQLKKDISNQRINLRTDHVLTTGALDDYLVYFKSHYDEPSALGNIAEGWIETSFDALYDVLRRFAQYDSMLQSDLSKCDLATLKCGEATDDTFNRFKSLLDDYVDIYVSMRPRSSNITLSKKTIGSTEFKQQYEGVVLYIDSDDLSFKTSSSGSTIGLSDIKLNRMISVSEV